MIINDLDCDIENLTRDDFPDESEATAQYVMAQASLAKIGRSRACLDMGRSDLRSIEHLLLPLIAFKACIDQRERVSRECRNGNFGHPRPVVQRSTWDLAARATRGVFDCSPEDYIQVRCIISPFSSRTARSHGNRPIHRFFKIEFIQRLRRKAPLSETQDYTNLISYASDITRDVENSLLHWSPECFPMIT